MSDRSSDWFRQAQRDLLQAEASLKEDSHPEGSPFEHYGFLQSQEAVSYAREILEFICDEMAKAKNR